MKSMKLAGAVLCVLALMAAPGLSRADDKDEKKSCCEATVAAGKKCAHECCVKAAENGKVCEKCHPKKDEKK